MVPPRSLQYRELESESPHGRSCYGLGRIDVCSGLRRWLRCWLRRQPRREEARTGAQNAAIGPAVSRRAGAKENFSDARLCVIPARKESQMVFEFARVIARGRRGVGVESLAENFFRGARLRSQFRETQKERFGNTPGAQLKDCDRLRLGRGLKYHRVQIFQSPRKFRQAAQNVFRFFDLPVQRSGTLEILLLACAVARGLQFVRKRLAACGKERDNALDFGVIFLLGAAGEARREAHFHFRIDTAGKFGVAKNFDVAAANFEKIEEAAREGFGGTARRKWAVIKTRCTYPPRDRAARIIVGEIYFQHRGRTQTRALTIRRGPLRFRVLPMNEAHLKLRAGDAIGHAPCEFAQVQPLRSWVGRTKQALETPA